MAFATCSYHFVSDDTTIVALTEREMVALWIDQYKCKRCAILLNNSQSLCRMNVMSFD